jgi:hypothetical protein
VIKTKKRDDLLEDATDDLKILEEKIANGGNK